MKLLRTLFMPLLLMHCVGSVHAQTGSIFGLVTDDRGEGLYLANVVLIDAEENAISTLKTDFGGIYTFNDLLPGTYTIKATYLEHRFEMIVSVEKNRTTFPSIITLKLPPVKIRDEFCRGCRYIKPIVLPNNPSFTQTMTARMGFYGRR